jgi:hypothetical protein
MTTHRNSIGMTAFLSFSHRHVGEDEVSATSLCQDNDNRQRWLVVGDGDLSYSASIAQDLARRSIELTATVLEEQLEHIKVYQRSETNTEQILRADDNHFHQVQFGVDATRLIAAFPPSETPKFNRIIFNFPHWRGKTNAKRNRQLVSDFLKSASDVLNRTNGIICIALCEGQGGFPAKSLAEWRQSWLVPALAAEHGLLLQKLEAFVPEYTQSSHRGVDRPWRKDGHNQLFCFAFPNKTFSGVATVDVSLQISCRHELRIMLHPTKLQASPVTYEGIVYGDAVFHLAQTCVPDGIDLEVAARELLTPSEWNDDHVPLAVFLMNYSGVSKPLTRVLADSIRARLEATVQEEWHLNVAKGGRLVSRPYPRHLLPSLIKEYAKCK